MMAAPPAGALPVEWRTISLAPPLVPRFDHTLTAVATQAGTQVYAVGGHGVPPGAEVQVLDPACTKWTHVALSFADGVRPDILQRGSHAAAAVGDSIFIFGGFGAEKTLGDVVELDTATATCRAPVLSGEAPSPRSSHTATAIGSRIYIIGGHGEDASCNDVFILDTAQGAWLKPQVLGAPPSARCAHSADAIGAARIAVFGGYGERPVGDLWFLEVDTPYVREHREKLGGGEEVVAWSRAAPGPSPTPVVICGPSGVGKGTLIGKLMKEFPGQCGFSVSHTTRKPRDGEVDGVHYNFTSRAAMEADVAGGKFLESADVHGNMYGTSIAAVQKVADSGKKCILDIDVQGARLVKKSPLRAQFVFVAPPSFEELEKRLRGRGTETEAAVEKRLANARAEMEAGKDAALFDHVLVNDNLEQAYAALKELLGLGGEGGADGGPEARSGHATAVLGSRLVVFGGAADRGVTLHDTYILETAALDGGAPALTRGVEWLPTERVPQGLWSSFLFLIGFDHAQPQARYNHKAVALGDGLALTAGGYDNGADRALGDTAMLDLGMQVPE